MKRNILWLTAVLAPMMAGAPREVTFSSPAGSVEAYDFVEVAVNITGPDARNPFTDATLRGTFGKTGGSAQTPVEGFCDSADGSIFHVGFLVAQVVGRRYSAVVGFENEADAHTAAALIKKATAARKK